MSLMKILACGDVHLNVNLLVRAYEIAQEEEVNLVLLVGDFCSGEMLPDTATPEDFITQAKPIIDTLERIEIPTFFVLGNHEPSILTPRLDSLSNVTDIHGRRLQLNDYWISGIGGSHSVVRQLVRKTLPFLEGILPELEGVEPPKGLECVRTVMFNHVTHNIYSSVQTMYQDVFPCDILVTHTPPLLPSGTSDYMMYSAGLYQLIEQYHPILAISGHVHHPKKHIEHIDWTGERQTILLNLGSLGNEKVGLINLKDRNELPEVEMLYLEE